MKKVFTATLVFFALGGAPAFALADAKTDEDDQNERCGQPAEVMQKYDANRDGKLSHEERKQMHQAQRAELLAKFDGDKNGQLSDEEKQALWQHKKTEHFARMDVDGNGSITKQEAEQGCGPLKRFFSSIDADANGAVTAEELHNAKPTRDGRRETKHHR